MVCTFFGHKNTQPYISNKLKEEIYKLIGLGVDTFLIGNNGNFDFIVQNILSDICRTTPFNDYKIILSRIDEQAISKNQDKTLFPLGFERFQPRFAISKRNEWLIKNSDFAIIYAENKLSNSYKLLMKSIKSGLTVINIADN